jgi:hypothetical protein
MTIAEGFYIPAPDPKGATTRYTRWVLGEVRGMVCYSKGGDEHFMCSAETFAKWIKAYKVRYEPKVDGHEMWAGGIRESA